MEIQALLNQVSTLHRQYEKAAEETGEKFNIFEVLRLATREVRTHSAFIGELLNPKGSHGMKDALLKLFCEQIPLTDIDCEQASVELEKYTGRISESEDEGGNIDIVITSVSGMVIIENKIYACDQGSQLKRYHNFGKRSGKPFGLLYLTLHGSYATDDSKRDLKISDIKNISYAKDIVDWLEKCRQKAAGHPILRETITQYIHLIKKLTGQTMNHQLKREVIDIIIENGDNLSASFDVANAVYDAKKKLLHRFAEQIKGKVKQSYPELTVVIKENFGDKWQGMTFNFPDLAQEGVLFSFLSHMRDFYLEVENEANGNDWKKKLKENVQYYQEHLDWDSSWGKTEDMNTGWNGDWVCRCTKLDTEFANTQTWMDLANGHSEKLVTEVVQNVTKILTVLKKKHSIDVMQS